MLAGIQRSFEVSGVRLDDVDPDDRHDWAGSIYSRFAALGLKDTYIAFFRIQSHYTHGNWHDLYAYHLALREDGGWEPVLEFAPIRPQPLIAALRVLASASTEYLLTFPGSSDRALLERRIADTQVKAAALEKAHEHWLHERPEGEQVA
jgi:hypothetical protein